MSVPYLRPWQGRPIEEGDAPEPPSLLARAHRAQAIRRRMKFLLPADLFVDPAWDMMLELVVAHETGQNLCVKDLVVVSGETAASGLRRISKLHDSALIQRSTDPSDHRRQTIELTETGFAGMSGLLDMMFEGVPNR